MTHESDKYGYMLWAMDYSNKKAKEKNDKCFCAQEGWVQTDTQDPDIWAETVDYPERELTYESAGRAVTLMVIEDLLARDKMGHKKHGRPLTKSTYSDFHKELYEELMDALVYLRALRENDD